MTDTNSEPVPSRGQSLAQFLRAASLQTPAKNNAGGGKSTPSRRQLSEMTSTQMTSSQIDRREELLLRPKLLKQGATVVETPPQTPRLRSSLILKFLFIQSIYLLTTVGRLFQRIFWIYRVAIPK